jgi:hypothetical protein
LMIEDCQISVLGLDDFPGDFGESAFGPAPVVRRRGTTSQLLVRRCAEPSPRVQAQAARTIGTAAYNDDFSLLLGKVRTCVCVCVHVVPLCSSSLFCSPSPSFLCARALSHSLMAQPHNASFHDLRSSLLSLLLVVGV